MNKKSIKKNIRILLEILISILVTLLIFYTLGCYSFTTLPTKTVPTKAAIFCFGLKPLCHRSSRVYFPCPSLRICRFFSVPWFVAGCSATHPAAIFAMPCSMNCWPRLHRREIRITAVSTKKNGFPPALLIWNSISLTPI